jgi:hypothetical protein
MPDEAQQPFKLETVFDLSVRLTQITASLLPTDIYEGIAPEEVAMDVQELFKDNLEMVMELTKPMDEDEAEGLGIMLPNDKLKKFLTNIKGEEIWQDPVFMDLWEKHLADPSFLTGVSAGFIYNAGALLAAWEVLKRQAASD